MSQSKKNNKAQSYDEKFVTEKQLRLAQALQNNPFDYEEQNLFQNINLQNNDYLDSGINPYLNQWSELGSQDPLGELKAQNQPGTSKALHGVGRVGTKVISELAKIPGVVGGLTAGTVGQVYDIFAEGDQVDFMETAFNNQWIKSINEINENVNKDLLPVHVKKAVETGNLWDNITSVDFWAKDGADGIGYIVSMMAPGMIISKAGTGAKMSQMLAKAGVAEETLQGLGFAGKAADVKLATFANTLLESGAEAQSVMEGYKGEVEARFRDGFYDKYGEQAQQKYEEDLAKASEVGRDVFLGNFAVLLGPNYIMANLMHGKKGVSKLGDKLIGDDGKFVSEIAQPKTYQKILNRAKDFGKGTISEGFWEEGMQTTMENYFKEKGLNPNSKLTFMDAYMDTLGSLEGQKAIFLGSILGGGMTSFQGGRSDIADRKKGNELISLVNKGISDFQDFHKTDLFKTKQDPQSGQTVLDLDENGKPQFNPVTLGERISSLDAALTDNLLYQMAIEQGNTKLAEQLQDKAITGFVMNFIQDEDLSIDLLNQYLEKSGIVEEMIQDSSNPVKDKKEFITKVINKAESLKRSHDLFMDFNDMINVQNDNATDEDYKLFTNKLYSNYMSNSQELDFFRNKLKEVQKKKQNLFDLKQNDPTFTLENLEGDNVALKSQLMQDDRVKSIVEEEAAIKQEIEKREKKESSFFKEKSYQEAFDNLVDKNKKIREATTKEDVDNAQDTIDKINKAESVEDLDDLSTDKNQSQSEKDEELKIIKNISKSIEEDPSTDNLNKALEILKNKEFKSFNVSKIIADIEKRINTQIENKTNLLNSIKKLMDEHLDSAISIEKRINEINSKVSSLEKDIQELFDNLEEIETQLKTKPESFKGRNAKIKRKFFKGLEILAKRNEELILQITDEINTLTLEKQNLESQLETIEKEITFSEEFLDMANKNNFSTVEELENVFNSLNENYDETSFTEAQAIVRFNAYNGRLKIVEKTLNTLKNTKDVLENEIKIKLNKIKQLEEDFENISQTEMDSLKDDLFTLDNHLNETIQELNTVQKQYEQNKKDLKEASDKLIRIYNDQKLELLNKLKSINNKYSKKINNNPIINNLVENKKAELKEKKDLKNTDFSENNAFYDKNAETHLQTVLTAMTEGDTFMITPNMKIANGKFDGQIAVITSITENKVNAKLEDGTGFSISKSIKLNKKSFNASMEYSTEGGTVETREEEKVFDSDLPSFTTNGSKLLSVTDKGEKLPFVSDNFIDFERNPNIKKIGQTVTFEVNTEATQNENWRLALSAFKNKDFSNLELLINHLPINVVFENGAKTPMETYYTSKEKGSEQFDKTSKILRTSIIKELAAGTELSSLSTTVEGQYNGTLKINEKLANNKVYDLYQFGGLLKNVTPDLIFVVDNQKVLKNHKGDIFPTVRDLKPGQIYIKIKTASGVDFPLKLNVQKISKSKAEVLYELYKYRFQDIKNNNKSLTLREIEDNELLDLIKNNLEKEIEVLNKSFNDITIKDLIDLLIWDGAESINSRIKFKNIKGKGTRLTVFDKEYTEEEFQNAKQDFIKNVSTNKRQHIKFKAKENAGSKAIQLSNIKYLEYLLTEGILSTNAVINEPTFQGRTNIYLDSYNLNVNGELSTFNPEREVIVDNKKLIGSNAQLKSLLPNVISKNLRLNEDESKYVDNKGEIYNRVSELKSDGKEATTASKESTVRGDVVDELIRNYFNELVTPDKHSFKIKASEILKQVNKKKKTQVDISNKAFDELYDILENYKKEFSKRNWMVFSTTNPLGGQIGNKKFAGAMDLLVYDYKNKEFIIVDVKTSSTSRAKSYNNPETDKFDYIGKDKIQQNAYAELFKQTTGKTISKIFILPLTVPKISGTFNVDSIQSDTQLLLEVDNSEDIYTLKNIKKVEVQKTEDKESLSNVDFGNSPKFDMSKFGITPKKEVKPQPKASNTTLNVDFKALLMKDYSKNKILEFELDGISYEIGTNSYIIVDKTNNKIITNKAKTFSIINGHNKKLNAEMKANPKLAQFLALTAIDTKRVQNAWKDRNVVKSENKSEKIRKSENNSVSLQKDNLPPVSVYENETIDNANTEFSGVSFDNAPKFDFGKFDNFENEETVEEKISEPVKPMENRFDFSTISEEKALTIFKDILKDPRIKSKLKEIMNISQKYSNNIEKLEAVVLHLDQHFKELNILEELRKKCNL